MDDQKFEQWMRDKRQELRKCYYQRQRSLLLIGIGLMIFVGLALLRYMWW